MHVKINQFFDDVNKSSSYGLINSRNITNQIRVFILFFHNQPKVIIQIKCPIYYIYHSRPDDNCLSL